MPAIDDWTDDGVFEVSPGVHRIPLPLPNDGLRAVNVYAIQGPDGLVLIDSGWALDESRTKLEIGLRGLDAGLSDIRRFLVTHVHRDHYTQAVAIRSTFGTRVSLGADEEKSLQAVISPTRGFALTRSRQLRAFGADRLAAELEAAVAGAPSEGIRNPWELPDDWLRDGDTVAVGPRNLAVVATPGHTVGHVVFVDAAASLLFAGDHVLPRITPSISFEAVSPPNPLGAFLTSLALVRAMPDRMLLPAHGPVTASVHARVDELIAHHGKRLDETEQAIANGAQHAFDAAHHLRWTRREHRLEDLDLFNRVLAVGETEAHLKLLAAQGRVRRTEIDGVHTYETV